VLRQHNTAHLLMTDKERARIQPEAESSLGFAHRCLGDLHGRNLASAVMRSRVHNRTRDRGGEPIRLMEGGIAPGPTRTGPGALSLGRREQSESNIRDGHHIG
jgi:hypothetical protein